MKSKINRLMSTTPRGVVLTSAWLTEQGYSLELQKRYRKSNWFTQLERGALVRSGDIVDVLGGIYTLQNQLGLSIHPGAKTALSLLGKSHYLELSMQRCQLFGLQSEKLPLWFKKHDWKLDVEYQSSSFLPAELGLTEFNYKDFKLRVSSPARAVMECLYLAPESQPLLEVFELMEGLNNLRPKSVQTLLEACASVKVKRLFLYMAEKAGHSWFNYLKPEAIDLGNGKRQIVPDGVYIPKYQITIPKVLERHT
ncbi:type IV toxin-antitoxin system AbiEi family antitoxin [Rheinheimera sp. KL1]|uniref:type IV toxin-antitoxin system AbiEi family antitoxin n=1 Tax=Rheinheimera sp. KL1 TaxID=1635005 RepID=UPI000A822C2F|nr:type IV toxin-antitoxin system AbiEi family antitoxin [Rheinheimera sp. KL1]